MNDTASPYLRNPSRSQQEAELQRQCDSLNWQLGVALSVLRNVSRSCPHAATQDAATAALTKITKGKQP